MSDPDAVILAVLASLDDAAFDAAIEELVPPDLDCNWDD